MEKKSTLVIVDDDTYILKAIQRVLANGPYNIAAYADPKEALQFIRENKVDLILSDFHMGSMTGFDLFAACDNINKTAVRLLMTGTPDASLEVNRLSSLKIEKVIFKPWDNDTFCKTIAQALSVGPA